VLRHPKGLMLDRRGWYNARSKNWFLCGVSNRLLDAKNEFGGKEKILFGGSEYLAGMNWRPNKKKLAGMNWRPNKN
jgi:hypothetical protein